MPAIIFADLFRSLIIAEGLYSLYIIFNIWYYLPKLMRKRGLSKKDSKLPKHIWTVSFAYGILTFFVCADLGARINKGLELSWKSYTGFVGLSFGVYSLIILLSHLKQQIYPRFG